ncbi:shikimate dehydrogenase [Arthrobacter sp. 35W]|uniref:shikimate dehydrogenase n=1 Tax=Arthrobacter sp. 35W TaxID=1132441 RepID=UPI001E446C0B|nr:shikimate dehydrogenase [Arthrobacter sp. 35W]
MSVLASNGSPASPAGRAALHRGAVLGHPIGHSKSPALHRAAYRLLGLDYGYTAIDVEQDGIGALVESVRSDGDWYGLSVTMPLKNAVIDSLDALSETAAVLGSVNTVVTERSGAAAGTLTGHNTDVAGIVNALKHAGVGAAPKAAILGGGGTAVSAVAALAALGAPGVDVYVRDVAKAASTADVAEAVSLPCRLVPFDGAAAALGGYDVVITTLPPRAADPLAEALPEGSCEGRFLLDVAYDPWPSAIAAAWSARGGSIVPGIEMLLYQAVEQVKLFTPEGTFAPAGTEADVINVMCDAIGLARR